MLTKELVYDDMYLLQLTEEGRPDKFTLRKPGSDGRRRKGPSPSLNKLKPQLLRLLNDGERVEFLRPNKTNEPIIPADEMQQLVEKIEGYDQRDLWQKLNEIRLVNQSNKEYGFDKSWKEFLDTMHCLFPATYGNRILDRFRRENGFARALNADMGDIQNGQGFREGKVSIIDNVNDSANFVQIRPWQNVNYTLLVYDMRDLPYRGYNFSLSSDHMNEELATNGQSAHGTVAANAPNINQEKAIRIKVGEQDWVRWTEQYLESSQEF